MHGNNIPKKLSKFPLRNILSVCWRQNIIAIKVFREEFSSSFFNFLRVVYGWKFGRKLEELLVFIAKVCINVYSKEHFLKMSKLLRNISRQIIERNLHNISIKTLFCSLSLLLKVRQIFSSIFSKMNSRTRWVLRCKLFHYEYGNAASKCKCEKPSRF